MHSLPWALDCTLGGHEAPRTVCCSVGHDPVAGRISLPEFVVCMSLSFVHYVPKWIRGFEELNQRGAGHHYSTDSVCTPSSLRPRRPSGLGRVESGQDRPPSICTEAVGRWGALAGSACRPMCQGIQGLGALQPQCFTDRAASVSYVHCCSGWHAAGPWVEFHFTVPLPLTLPRHFLLLATIGYGPER